LVEERYAQIDLLDALSSGCDALSNGYDALSSGYDAIPSSESGEIGTPPTSLSLIRPFSERDGVVPSREGG
jgi:hypothetical protein